jgi:hypothetical protein
LIVSLQPVLEPSCHVFGEMPKTGMNIRDSPISPLSTSSTVSAVWAQFLAKTDTKDTKTHRLILAIVFLRVDEAPNSIAVRIVFVEQIKKLRDRDREIAYRKDHLAVRFLHR